MNLIFPRYFVLISFVFLPFTVAAKKVVIQGVAHSFAGLEVEAYRYLDFISLRKSKFASITIEKNEHFELSFETNFVEYISLSVDNKSVNLYCEPGKVYNISLSDLNETNPFNQSLKLSFNFSTPDELNMLVSTFLDEYARFLVQNEKLLITKGAYTAIKKFEEAMAKKYENETNEYFRLYLKYNLAALEDGVLGNKKEIFEKNFATSPILRNNFEYMSLFCQFYKKRFSEIALGKEGLQFQSAVNGTTDYSKLLGIVKNNKYLNTNDTLCELFILNGLRESYHDKAVFKKQNILAMLHEIESKGIDEPNRNIASNIIFALTYLTKGFPAPEFNLTAMNNKQYSLKEFSGKPLYIQFWSSKSTASLREMILLDELYKKYDGQFGLLSVNIDRKKEDMLPPLKEKNYGWIFAHIGTKKEMLEKYRIKTLPAYILIDKNGNIAQYPAMKPTENVERELYDLIGN